MKFSFSLVAASAMLAAPAFAKVTVFTTTDVAAYVLKSDALNKLRAPGQRLANLELENLTISVEGNGIGEKYEAVLKFSSLRGASLEACEVVATVKNEKAPAPGGITANRLSAPAIAKPNCVE